MEDTTQGAGGTITKPLCIPDQCIDGTVTPITLHLPKDLGNLSPEMENYLEEGLRTIFSASGLNMEHDFFVRRNRRNHDLFSTALVDKEWAGYDHNYLGDEFGVGETETALEATSRHGGTIKSGHNQMTLQQQQQLLHHQQRLETARLCRLSTIEFSPDLWQIDMSTNPLNFKKDIAIIEVKAPTINDQQVEDFRFFLPFPRLPEELQILVWEHARPGPEFVRMHFGLRILKETQGFQEYLEPFLLRSPESTYLATTCRLSRKIFREEYEAIDFDYQRPEGKVYAPGRLHYADSMLPKEKRTQPVMWISTTKDTLFLSQSARFETFGLHGVRFKNKLSHLALEQNKHQEWFNASSMRFALMLSPHLHSLTIIFDSENAPYNKEHCHDWPPTKVNSPNKNVRLIPLDEDLKKMKFSVGDCKKKQVDGFYRPIRTREAIEHYEQLSENFDKDAKKNSARHREKFNRDFKWKGCPESNEVTVQFAFAAWYHQGRPRAEERKVVVIPIGDNPLPQNQQYWMKQSVVKQPAKSILYLPMWGARINYNEQDGSYEQYGPDETPETECLRLATEARQKNTAPAVARLNWRKVSDA